MEYLTRTGSYMVWNVESATCTPLEKDLDGLALVDGEGAIASLPLTKFWKIHLKA